MKENGALERLMVQITHSFIFCIFSIFNKTTQTQTIRYRKQTKRTLQMFKYLLKKWYRFFFLKKKNGKKMY